MRVVVNKLPLLLACGDDFRVAHRQIFIKYAKGMLIVDVLSVFPFDAATNAEGIVFLST